MRMFERGAARYPMTTWEFVAVLLLFCVVPARATVVVSKDFSALCAEADMIFVGTVTDVRSQWADVEQRRIETLVTFSSLDALWGVDADAVTLRFSGGRIGDLAEIVAGVPRFSTGERVVVFARNGRLVSPIVGFNQGRFHVTPSPDGPVVIDAGRRAGGGASAAQAADKAARGCGAGGIPLAAFTDKVREQLGKRQGVR